MDIIISQYRNIGKMEAQRNGTPMLASSGYVAQVDSGLCAGCGECADVCPQEAIDLLRDPAKGEPLAIRKRMAKATD